ncbi:ABC-type Fe3+/spermidine/putrescine transport system ATPase subunit [Vreelandella songnenensis]|uniref:ABC-type Fe3+/spermidine/putrescine transport system ATPase subunit n=1 Tax=Vreelandella songnenensis TaxID=1176243 RepID=A0A2T0UYY1_9GAMM|nr:ABC transporter ATP-binding protein [Halomonas songnenensis]PRY63121.1 ABC-type Fe3+/spermidine/putrescine transport system ATPase subunit [Halomonas songnenensis]
MSTEALTLNNVTVDLGRQRILDDIHLDVSPGSFTCLLGPSGCGKTTLLRAIAGFTPLSRGEIRLGRRALTHLPPEKRETAMVFQSYALWPHMSVEENLGYPLKLRGVTRTERRRKVAEMLARLELSGFEERAVTKLSGGQRQRIALGRALIIDPPLLLLDEPLSNLDAAIRRSLRSELRRLQKSLGITTIMVTHDQEEALQMADQIVLMRAGHVVQVSTPQTLYQQPADLGAARFLGVDNTVTRTPQDPMGESGAVTFGFRTRDAHLDAPPCPQALIRKGRVTECVYTGDGYHVLIDTHDAELFATSATPVAPGTFAALQVPESALIPFGPDDRHLPPLDRHEDIA